MKYILNSAVITSEGTYEYKHVDATVATKWLKTYPDAKSYIGYEETAKALEAVTGIRVQVSRGTIKMGVGDSALIFRLNLGNARIDPRDKGNIGVDRILANCEIGILVRLA